MKNTFWSADQSQIPQLKPHTKAKHQLLSQYIEEWVYILCKSHPAYDNTITLVDGFCGGGLYSNGSSELWEGSPLRMIRSVEKGHKRVCQEGKKENHRLHYKFLFIDSNKEHLLCLKKALRDRGFGEYLDQKKCILQHGEFSNRVSFCLEQAQKGSSFFFLDPFGVDDIFVQDVKRIVSLRGSEVLWSFMINGLTRLLSDRDKNRKIIQDILELDSYFIDIPESRDAKYHQYLRNEVLTLIREKSGVKYLYPFALMEQKNTVLYYLVHLASNVRAIEVMKKSMWEYNNLEYRYHYDTYGTGYRYFEEIGGAKFYDVDSENIQECKDDLYERILRSLQSNNEGQANFARLRDMLVEKTPGSETHIIDSLYDLRSFKEVEIVKPSGTIFSGRSPNGIKKEFIIKVPSQPTIFDLRNLK